ATAAVASTRMRVLVLGGGVVGVTTAYYLARDGCEVELVEAAGELATDATAGNAGLIAPGHSFAWASPRAPAMLARSLLGRQTAIRYGSVSIRSSCAGGSASSASARPTARAATHS